MRILKIFLVLILALMVTYMLGPRPGQPELDPGLPELSVSINDLDAYLAGKEAAVQDLKPENESHIVWADSSPTKTPYSIVYLHGFSASPMEGQPVHTEIADRFGANLYLHRMHGHGIDSEESFVDLTPQDLVSSAAEALAIGSLIGDSVILMSCSTGGTVSVYLAAHHQEVHSLIMYSPNIGFAKPGSNMLTKPWGLELARMSFKGKYRSLEDWPEMQPYWTMKYRLEGLVNLKLLVETAMVPETFEKIDQPVFLGYYYKSEEEQDEIVSVEDMLWMYSLLGTPNHHKRRRPFAEAESHVINSEILSKDVEGVIRETDEFCREVLGMAVAQ